VSGGHGPGGRQQRRSAILVIGGAAPPLTKKTFGKLAQREDDNGEDPHPDIYRINPVLGPYPAELELVYPFAQTLAAEEPSPQASVEACVAKLKTLGYARVVLARGWSKGAPGRDHKEDDGEVERSAKSQGRQQRRRHRSSGAARNGITCGGVRSTREAGSNKH
jgi:hypothetical protein